MGGTITRTVVIFDFFQKNILVDNSGRGVVRCIVISFIIESISGDVLPYLNDKDYIYLGIKEKLREKIQKYVSDNIFLLTKNELEIDININSSETEVEKFFKNNFNLKKQIKNINGKNLFSLTEKKMKNLGLNLGQRKKLNVFLEHNKKNFSRNHDNVKENISTIKETEKKEIIINIPLPLRKAIFIKEEKKRLGLHQLAIIQLNKFKLILNIIYF